MPDGYQNLILADGPLVYLPLDDDPAGGTFTDLSGNARHGTRGGDTTGFSLANHGPTGKSLRLNNLVAPISYVALPSALTFTGDFTLEVWCRWVATPPTAGTMPMWGHSADAGGFKYANESSRFHFEIPRSTGYNADQGYEPRDRSWYHTAVVREGTTIFLYVNGQIATRRTVAVSTVSVQWIGADQKSAVHAFNDGWLAHAAAYDKALPQSTIRRRLTTVARPPRPDSFMREVLRSDPYEAWMMTDRNGSGRDYVDSVAQISNLCAGLVRGLPLYLQDEPNPSTERRGRSFPYYLPGSANHFAISMAGQNGDDLANERREFTLLAWVSHNTSGANQVLWNQRGADGAGQSLTAKLAEAGDDGRPGFFGDTNSVLHGRTYLEDQRSKGYRLFAYQFHNADNAGTSTHVSDFRVVMNGAPRDSLLRSDQIAGAISSTPLPKYPALLGRHEAWNTWASAAHVAGLALFHRKIRDNELRRIYRAGRRGADRGRISRGRRRLAA